MHNPLYTSLIQHDLDPFVIAAILREYTELQTALANVENPTIKQQAFTTQANPILACSFIDIDWCKYQRFTHDRL
jgi:hypothetical protein